MAHNGLSIDELMTTCQECDGKGRLPEKIEKTGYNTRITPAQSCNRCCGTGHIPTENGRVILEFFRTIQRDPNFGRLPWTS